jgi:hypothetical protein
MIAISHNAINRYHHDPEISAALATLEQFMAKD